MTERSESAPLEAAAAVAASSGLALAYSLASLVAALAARGSIDPQLYFAMLRTIVDGLQSGMVQPAETARLSAEMLRRVEETFHLIITIPPGAGRA